MDYEEREIVTTNMRSHGGGFVKALAEAIEKADSKNYEKIKSAFSDYWKKYYNNRKLFTEPRQKEE